MSLHNHTYDPRSRAGHEHAHAPRHKRRRQNDRIGNGGLDEDNEIVEGVGVDGLDETHVSKLARKKAVRDRTWDRPMPEPGPHTNSAKEVAAQQRTARRLGKRA